MTEPVAQLMALSTPDHLAQKQVELFLGGAGGVMPTVLSYGAVGNGTTSDVDGFEDAEASGKTVFIPQTGHSYTFPTTMTTTGGGWLSDPTLTWDALTDGGQFSLYKGFFTSDSASIAHSPNGANIWRFSDRVFVGLAASQFAGNRLSGVDGGNSFFSNQANAPQYVIRDAALGVISPNGNIGIGSAVRVSTNPDAPASNPLAFAGAIVNDVAGTTAWGGIIEGQHESGAAQTNGWEIVVKNKGTNLTQTPYSRQGGTFGLWMAGGGDATFGGAATNPSNTAIAIVGSTASATRCWNVGLLFESGGLAGTDGVTGTATAISMARGHTIQWLGPGGVVGGSIVSIIDAAASNVQQIFDDGTVHWTGTQGDTIFSARHTANGVNYLEARNGLTGNAAQLVAQGETDIDLRLIPAGTGVVMFGTNSAKGAEAFSSFITIKDSTGTPRKLMVCA